MKVGVIMGSTSDLEVMSAAFDVLDRFRVPYEKKVISAHRAPALLAEYATTARDRGLDIIIAGAGGAAHLPGVTASMTTIPVIGVPINGKAFGGMDALLSMVQMPSGIPVATVSVNGAKNAALLAVSILSLSNPGLAAALQSFREQQAENIKRTEI
ncbi:MAG: 5-(carboxyamino)imidazole ribonucleotide mutase [Bacteroidales bacterium]|jgi:5-(carboxyamino)imidazole ribonucleotide mutase|nr:5-(carboxyamino)imidazole ribonucleotide mutase [Bacteroidales bacterium]MBQ2104297.1 5-(carboxyamino)imidazole ribonucleotide mutase [Bacteroidales bacterium]MBQ2502075.1 5-(carboxyamino)imidazole ribonucleotide mutase [Bacteroidales bacterium]MBQ3984224.1 5-(carboxyamino)imidazole ribonucleotide mutase [Bacteroidales bacterium]MBQ5417006.1 5-(carboxyamino)imidazole ribonucleotide mutase [Bacteroidales bacterium]